MFKKLSKDIEIQMAEMSSIHKHELFLDYISYSIKRQNMLQALKAQR